MAPTQSVPGFYVLTESHLGDGDIAQATLEAVWSKVVPKVVPEERAWTFAHDSQDPKGRNAFFVRADELGIKEAWAIVGALQKRTEIAAVEFQSPVPTEQRPPLPQLDREWSFKRINADTHHAKGGGDGIIIGHPDTGYTYHSLTYPRLHKRDGVIDLGRNYDALWWSEQRRYQRDAFDYRQRFPRPWFHGHGTATSSVFVRVAPKATFIPYKVTDNVVLSFKRSRQLAQAIDQAVRDGCHVMSISLGGPLSSELAEAVERATEAGLVICAAAGNGVGLVPYPAALHQVIAVGATTTNDLPWRHSSYGTAVDISAPGEHIHVASANVDATPLAPSNGMEFGSGTSFAVAAVAGAVALWMGEIQAGASDGNNRTRLLAALTAKLREKGVRDPIDARRYLPRAIKLLLQQTAKNDQPKWDRQLDGAGIVDCARLLTADLNAFVSTHEGEIFDSIDSKPADQDGLDWTKFIGAFKELIDYIGKNLDDDIVWRFLLEGKRPDLKRYKNFDLAAVEELRFHFTHVAGLSSEGDNENVIKTIESQFASKHLKAYLKKHKDAADRWLNVFRTLDGWFRGYRNLASE